MPVTVKLHAGIGGFAGNKDEAKDLRLRTILPAFQNGQAVTLDFSEVKNSTQSFVHALLGEVLQRFGESALDKLEFRDCSSQVKSLVQLVVDYSLGGFQKDEAITIDATSAAKGPKGSPKKSPSRSHANGRTKE